ncbi:hypothetical protein MRX96_020158 [Rhipicephalus microplus]
MALITVALRSSYTVARGIPSQILWVRLLGGVVALLPRDEPAGYVRQPRVEPSLLHRCSRMYSHFEAHTHARHEFMKEEEVSSRGWQTRKQKYRGFLANRGELGGVGGRADVGAGRPAGFRFRRLLCRHQARATSAISKTRRCRTLGRRRNHKGHVLRTPPPAPQNETPLSP